MKITVCRSKCKLKEMSVGVARGSRSKMQYEEVQGEGRELHVNPQAAAAQQDLVKNSASKGTKPAMNQYHHTASSRDERR
jgi:hypothetical protein